MGSSSSKSKSKEVRGKKNKVKNGKVAPVQEEGSEEPVVEISTKNGKAAKQNNKKAAKADKKKKGKKQKHKGQGEADCEPSVTELSTEQGEVVEQNGKKGAHKNDKKNGKGKQKKHVKDTAIEQPVVMQPCAKKRKACKKGKGEEQHCKKAAEETDKKIPKNCEEKNDANNKNDKIVQKHCKPAKQNNQFIIAYDEENSEKASTNTHTENNENTVQDVLSKILAIKDPEQQQRTKNVNHSNSCTTQREQERERGGSLHQTQVDTGRKPKITNGHLDVVEGHQALEMEIAEQIRTLEQEKISVTANLPVLDLGQATSEDDNDSTDDGLSYDGEGGIRYERAISFENNPEVSKLRHLNKHRAPMQQKRKPARFSRPEDQVQVTSAKPQKLKKDKKGGGKEKKKDKQKVKKTRSISDPNSVAVV